MHDHPGCVHGIVVALRDAGKEEWSSTSMGDTYTWLVSYAATGQEAEKKLILESTRVFGYNTSRYIQWYRDYGGQRAECHRSFCKNQSYTGRLQRLVLPQ